MMGAHPHSTPNLNVPYCTQWPQILLGLSSHVLPVRSCCVSLIQVLGPCGHAAKPTAVLAGDFPKTQR